MLLTGSEDGCVYGWETRSGQLLWRLGGHTGPVKFCRFSPDGHLFASASCDCTVRLWDVARAKCLQVLKGHQRSVETVSFSPDSRQLASGGWDKRVMLWEVQSGQMLRLLVGHRDSVQSSDFSPTVNCLVRLTSALGPTLVAPYPLGEERWEGDGLRDPPKCGVGGELAGPDSQKLPAGHRLLGLHHTHLGPADGDPSRLPPGARGTQWQHQLPVLLSIWPPGKWVSWVPGWSPAGSQALKAPRPQTPGIRAVCCPGLRFLGQDHPHLEAHNQQPAYPTEGPRHLGEERSLLSRRAVAGQRRLFPHGQSLGLQHRKVPRDPEGSPGCGPHLCLHPRWENLSVWSCRSDQTSNIPHDQITQRPSNLTPPGRAPTSPAPLSGTPLPTTGPK
ncbi:PREDICTED: WD repeat-containing protein 38 isoform X2 [Cercocebus atys]|uniref:WD repeat-containing protein 38 isoform X2 n=1 Tax=Cercocebus atys TaxID=9531 RepID=UPI0005F4850D|nr:PREDICTED: WD repeat-containing protein 38 isoform X2 [Cercocebus atys]